MFGKRETIAMSVINYVDNSRRDLEFYIKWLLDKNLRRVLSENKALRNKHKGERCFVIGNGPSLKHYDLGKLSKEYVFTVNFMMKSDYFEILNPDYHFFFDPIVFDLDPTINEERERLELVAKTKKTNPNLNYIIPYRRGAHFYKNFPNHKFNYTYNNKTFTRQLKNSSALHRNNPGFQNVIIYAINAAIYMGFKEIYLLGVDMTGFLEHFEYKKTNNEFGHSYTKSEEEKEYIKKVLKEKKYDNEFYLKAYGKIFEHFKLINKDAIRNNTKLMNASSHGGLDVIERVSFDKIDFE